MIRLPKHLRSFAAALALAVALVLTAAPQGVNAQTSGPNKPIHGATPGGTDAGTSSDSELWRAIRRGDRFGVSTPNKTAGIMIQSTGQDWRLFRMEKLPMYAGWAILGMCFLLCLFFAIRGRIRVSHGLSGEVIRRFSLLERTSHWILASSFILLALTGLNLLYGRKLLIPLIGKGAFSTIADLGKHIHNYVAFAFMAGLALIFLRWVIHNFPNRHDVMWFLRGGGLFGGGHPAARKFNGGQKVLFWLVILGGLSISVSGWALLYPFTTTMFNDTFVLVNSVFGTHLPTNLNPIQEQQFQSLWHSIMAVFLIIVIIAHIYIGSVGMQGALAAMTSGDVDKNWARDHHSLWVEEEEAKESSEGADYQPAE